MPRPPCCPVENHDERSFQSPKVKVILARPGTPGCGSARGPRISMSCKAAAEPGQTRRPGFGQSVADRGALDRQAVAAACNIQLQRDEIIASGLEGLGAGITNTAFEASMHGVQPCIFQAIGR